MRLKTSKNSTEGVVGAAQSDPAHAFARFDHVCTLYDFWGEILVVSNSCLSLGQCFNL